MQTQYIVPVVKSIQNVFQTMLRIDVKVGTPAIKPNNSPSYDISGIIGLSGGVEGAVVLSFPTKSAEAIVSKFVGMEMPHTHEDFADAIGELINMISCAAKAKFKGAPVSISCPSVVIGSNHVISNRKDVVCIMIPCESECGNFAVEVSIKPVNAAAAADSVAASA